MVVWVPRPRRNYLNHVILRILFGLIFIYVYCEYLIYYVTQVQCGWSVLNKESHEGIEPVYAMVIADTHLLGSRNGHWFDKWRREWQMHRAFQTAMTLHNPEVVFVLGDLFDEGKWCPEKEFNDYVDRFNRLFKVPDSTALYSVVGNHDIGYHYRITPHLAKRFESKLKSPPVQMVSIRGNHFVLINSMAMEGDGCTLCARTVAQISNISNILRCSSGSSLCKGKKRLAHYSRPIIMQVSTFTIKLIILIKYYTNYLKFTARIAEFYWSLCQRCCAQYAERDP
ncbi:unnamed protein product [Chrysodeixis includens]|uniref:Calcineurin-like phosphoesterase domain-containing protein n=1 Tax=Chrysodeixis includens TaxID=689277 RepID=A0A9P0FV43_CHRIL|nr:unnamed protein product [Chrysodeixis includens]